jgi:hypothetical protein
VVGSGVAAACGIAAWGGLTDRYCSRTQDETFGDVPLTRSQPGQSPRAYSIVTGAPSGQPVDPVWSSHTDRIRTPSPAVLAM